MRLGLGSFLAVGLAVSLAVSPASAKPSAQSLYEACAAVASSSFEAGRSRTGLTLEQLDPSIAIPTCEEALRAGSGNLDSGVSGFSA